ncbi:MAG: DUF2339 domain-containing protein [Gemmatimonadetes bacterium]|nr:DUF2339 domain-containing protein [Gemmatimonadota bacterium]
MHDYEALAARMERLERVVEELARRLPAAPLDALPARRPEPAAIPLVRPAAAVAREPVRWDGQLWLNRLGIGLLLLGVAFLFRYSIDMGWITPAVRVGFVTAVGVTLLAAGLRIGGRGRFGPVLVGGGIAVFYIVGWAAFNLYSLIGYTAAFAGMVAVTGLAFGLALRKNEPALGILGAIGGLGTPLLLGISYGSPRGLALYTCVIVGWTAALHLRRSWRWVLWTTLAFGWVLLCRYAYHVGLPERLVAADAWVLQGAALFAWVCTGVLPLAVRHRREGREPRWTDLDALHWYGVSLVPPAAALLTTGLIWTLSPVRWGGAAIASASIYGAAALFLWNRDLRISRVLALASSVMLTAGMIGALKGNPLLAGLAVQALALHALAGLRGGQALRWTAHKAYIGAGAWLVLRLMLDAGAGWGNAVTGVVVLACGFAASYLVPRHGTMLAYRYFVHAALLGFLWRELARIDGGEGFATVAWGAYALGLLFFGMSRGRALVEKTALATLLVLVAKLFLVDLAALEAIYRILLFLGFGAVFLFFSYALQSWLRPRPAEPPAPRVAG